MNSKERTEYLYQAMAEMLQYIDPHGFITINAHDAYGAMVTFVSDDTTESKLSKLLQERGFELTDGEESLIYSKDIEEYGASIILSKSKTNVNINLNITV